MKNARHAGLELRIKDEIRMETEWDLDRDNETVQVLTRVLHTAHNLGPVKALIYESLPAVLANIIFRYLPSRHMDDTGGIEDDFSDTEPWNCEYWYGGDCKIRHECVEPTMKHIAHIIEEYLPRRHCDDTDGYYDGESCRIEGRCLEADCKGRKHYCVQHLQVYAAEDVPLGHLVIQDEGSIHERNEREREANERLLLETYQRTVLCAFCDSKTYP